VIPSKNCIDLIKSFEGLFLKAYVDPVGIPTIGYGSIKWPDGKNVQLGQEISIQTAEQLLIHEVNSILPQIPKLSFNQNQFDAVVSFIYNVGIGSFKRSTMLRKMRQNVNEWSIRDEFMKWNKGKVNGQLVELKGLTRRRKAEADLYFK
jgi:lysozyme